jgi:hypothetical protein
MSVIVFRIKLRAKLAISAGAVVPLNNERIKVERTTHIKDSPEIYRKWLVCELKEFYQK